MTHLIFSLFRMSERRRAQLARVADYHAQAAVDFAAEGDDESAEINSRMAAKLEAE